MQILIFINFKLKHDETLFGEQVDFSDKFSTLSIAEMGRIPKNLKFQIPNPNIYIKPKYLGQIYKYLSKTHFISIY